MGVIMESLCGKLDKIASKFPPKQAKPGHRGTEESVLNVGTHNASAKVSFRLNIKMSLSNKPSFG
jgi:hypothetical protein